MGEDDEYFDDDESAPKKIRRQRFARIGKGQRLAAQLLVAFEKIKGLIAKQMRKRRKRGRGKDSKKLTAEEVIKMKLKGAAKRHIFAWLINFTLFSCGCWILIAYSRCYGPDSMYGVYEGLGKTLGYEWGFLEPLVTCVTLLLPFVKKCGFIDNFLTWIDTIGALGFLQKIMGTFCPWML